jgi:O-antigen/teichoic acid export membrane protein
MQHREKVVTGVKWTTLSAVIVAITSIIKISILARFLDKHDFGLMALVNFVIGFTELFNDLGISSAILHKQNISTQEYSSLYWLNIITGIIMYVIVCLITPYISNYYKYEELNTLIPLVSMTLIISAIGRQFKVIDSKNLLFKNIAIVEITTILFSLFISVLLATTNYGIYSLIYSTLCQVILANLIYLILGFRKHKISFHYRFSETKPFLRVGGYQVAGQITNYFNRDIDILLIAHFFSSEVLGGYNLAKQLVFRPMQIVNPILTRVASPALAKVQGNPIKIKEDYLKLLNIVSTLNFSIYIALIVFAPLVVEILYGKEMISIVVLVRILSVSMMFRAIGNPIGSLVVATGRTDLEFGKNLVTLFITPIFVLIGAQHSVIGAAAAIVIAMIVLFVPTWKILINSMIGVSFREYLKAIFVIDILGIRNIVLKK